MISISVNSFTTLSIVTVLTHITSHHPTVYYVILRYNMSSYRMLGLGIIGKVGKAAEESGVSIHAVLQVRTRTYCVVLYYVVLYYVVFCCVMLCCFHLFFFLLLSKLISFSSLSFPFIRIRSLIVRM